MFLKLKSESFFQKIFLTNPYSPQSKIKVLKYFYKHGISGNIWPIKNATVSQEKLKENAMQLKMLTWKKA